jgi:hypothetical protein
VANLIKNDSFKCIYDDDYIYSDIKYKIADWKHINLNIKPTYNSNTSVPSYVDSLNGTPRLEYDEIPGIYQAIDLSDYQSNVRLRIKFQVTCFDEFSGTDFCFYIYKVRTLDTLSVDKFNIAGTYKDYIHKSKYTVEPIYLETFTVIVTLEPGIYALGFGCDMLSYDDRDECTFYDINGLRPHYMDVVAVETNEIGYINLLDDASFYSSGLGRQVLTSDESKIKPPEDIYRNTSNLIHSVYHTSTSSSLSYLETNRIGAYYSFRMPEIQGTDYNIDEFTARLRLWYRSDLPEGTKFKIILVDGIKNTYINEVLTTKKEWTLYTFKIDWVQSENYKLYIIPPVESNSMSNPLYIGYNGEFNYYTESASNSRTGDFDNPYNYEDGCLVWEYTSDGEYTPKFKLDSGKNASENKFIYIRNSYYLTKDNDGTLYCDGFYNFIEYLRYFSPQCKMYILQNVIIDNKCVEIDANGMGTIKYSIMDYFDAYIEGFDKNVKVLDFLEGDSFTIQTTFSEMYPPITMDLDYDRDVLSVINIIDNVENSGLGQYNTSNTIEFLVKSSGKTELTVSHTNQDGTIFKKSFIIYATDELQYSNDIVLELPYEETYMKSRQIDKVSCLVVPIRGYEVPIDWISSNERIAIVDAFGNVTAMTLGVCTITAINHRTGRYASYKLNVVQSLESSTGVLLSQEEVNIGIGDLFRVTAILLNESNTNENIRQRIEWQSLDTNIATVDEFGCIKGAGEGTTTIGCVDTTSHKPMGYVTVKVSQSIPLDYIELDVDDIPFIIGDNSAYETLEAILIPENTTQSSIVWSSNDDDVAIINKAGRLSPNTNATQETTCIIRCLSLTKPGIYAECTASLVSRENYVPVIYLPKTPLTTFVDKVNLIKYSISNTNLIEKTVSVSIKKTNGSNTLNVVSLENGYIKLTCFEMGDYIITVTCTYTRTWVNKDEPKTISKSYGVHIQGEDEPPVFAKNLSIEDTFYNGSYILKYLVEDDLDTEVEHEIFVDDEATDFEAYSHLYNNSKYHYVFGKGLKSGEHSIYVVATDSSGNSIESDPITFTIKDMNNYSYKAVLEESKNDSYDFYRNDVVDCLNNIIKDQTLSLNEKREFDVRYQKFCFAYEEFRFVLDTCIKYIDNQIGTAQIEISTLAAGLTSDGVSVTTYSEGDYTNSNYQSITDMDYYQNVCIKELTNRVLQLEALIQELMNNK